jgi:hypothetical protein
MSSLEWNALTILTALVSLQIGAAWYVPAVLLACTLSVGISYGFQARVESPYHGFWSRVLISLLAICQPMVRGWARYSTWMRKKRTPSRMIESSAESHALRTVWDRPALLSFWSEQGVGREQFLKAFETRLNREGWKYSADTGWTDWDYQVYGNRWWQARLLTATEEHGDGKRLTRVRLRPRLSTFSGLVGSVFGVISLLAFLRFWATTSPEGFQFIGVWFCLLSAWLAFMVWRSARLRRRIARLAELAARDCNLTPLHDGR